MPWWFAHRSVGSLISTTFIRRCDGSLTPARFSSIYFSQNSHFVQIGVSRVQDITEVSHHVSAIIGPFGRTTYTRTLGSNYDEFPNWRRRRDGMEEGMRERCKAVWQHPFRLPRTVGELGLSRQPSSNGRVRASLSQSSPHQTTQQFPRQLST